MTTFSKLQKKSWSINISKTIVIIVLTFFYMKGYSENIVVDECLLYENQPIVACIDGEFISELPYTLMLPLGIIDFYCGQNSFMVFLYENGQVILIKSLHHWINWYEEKYKDFPKIHFNGYVFSGFDDMSYLIDKKNDLASSDNDDIDDIVFDASLEDKGYHYNPQNDRKNCIFTRDGVKVILFNILPENMDYFLDLTYNSLTVPPFNDKIDYSKRLGLKVVGHYKKHSD